MYFYLTKLGTDTDHGGPFVYRSADTDMLGWVCERAAGARMADLISLLIWQPMGAEFDAEITCDGVGSAIHDGGMSARARDMARFGQLVLEDGYVHDTSIVPERWLREARALDPDIRGAFAASDSEPVLTGGWYRNQFWFVPGPLGDLQLCLGIHGQMVLVDRATRTVSVKMSSWPTAQDADGVDRHYPGIRRSRTSLGWAYRASRCSERAWTDRTRRGPRARTQLT